MESLAITLSNILPSKKRNPVKFLLSTLCFVVLGSSVLYSMPRTPSQALPDMFRKPPALDYKKFNRENTFIPQVPEIEKEVFAEEKIKITPVSVIILTPKILQGVIDVNKYSKLLVGKDFEVQGLYDIAFQIEQDFSRKGYPLVRVTLPVQELEADQATVFFKVIDGFIEKIDISKVPKQQILRTYSYLKPLVNKRALTLKNLERQLLLASNTSGISLSSALSPGEKDGGTILVVEGTHKLLSGGLTFENSQNKELGRTQGQVSTSIHSPMGLGETFTAFGLAKPSTKGLFGSGYDVPIRAGGVATSIPIGNDGLTFGASYTESMTRPGEDVESLGLEANMKAASVNISYPIEYRRDLAILSRFSLNWIDEIQHTNVSGLDEEISHDRITSLKAGIGFNRCTSFCLSLDTEITKGLRIGSRSKKDSNNGTPLSRGAADVDFSHINASVNYKGIAFDNFQTSLRAGGQYSFSGSLLNSEQMGIAGESKLSGFASGAISGDEAWFVRAQMNRNINLSDSLFISPYLYAASGKAYLSDSTSAELSKTFANALGVGVEFGGPDNIFIEKSVTGKFEFSKNRATSTIEKTHDTRLSDNQMFLRVSMNF